MNIYEISFQLTSHIEESIDEMKVLKSLMNINDDQV